MCDPCNSRPSLGSKERTSHLAWFTGFKCCGVVGLGVSGSGLRLSGFGFGV